MISIKKILALNSQSNDTSSNSKSFEKLVYKKRDYLKSHCNLVCQVWLVEINIGCQYINIFQQSLSLTLSKGSIRQRTLAISHVNSLSFC